MNRIKILKVSIERNYIQYQHGKTLSCEMIEDIWPISKSNVPNTQFRLFTDDVTRQHFHWILTRHNKKHSNDQSFWIDCRPSPSTLLTTHQQVNSLLLITNLLERGGRLRHQNGSVGCVEFALSDATNNGRITYGLGPIIQSGETPTHTHTPDTIWAASELHDKKPGRGFAHDERTKERSFIRRQLETKARVDSEGRPIVHGVLVYHTASMEVINGGCFMVHDGEVDEFKILRLFCGNCNDRAQ